MHIQFINRLSEKRSRLALAVRYGAVLSFVVARIVTAVAAAAQPNAVEPRAVRLDLYGDPLPPGAVARLGSMRDYIGFESGDIVLSPDGKTITATSSFFNISLRLWDVSTGRVILNLKQLDPPIRERDIIVRRAAFSPDAKLLAAGDSAGTVRIGRTDTGQKVLEISGSEPVSGLRFLPGRKMLAVTYLGGTTRLYAIASGERIRSFGPRDRLPDDLDQIRHRFLSPNGKLRVQFSGDGDRLILREPTTDRELRRFPYFRRAPGLIDETWETHIVFSPDGKLLAAGDTPESLCLWSVETGQVFRRFPHQDAGHGIVFTPDGKRLITGGRYFRHWDIARGQEIRRFPQHAQMQFVAFGPTGATLVTADGTTVRLWESSTGRELRQFTGHRTAVIAAAIASDSSFIASGEINGTVILWEPSTGREVRRLADRAPGGAVRTGADLDEIPSIAFAPDARTFAATVNRGTSLRDVAAGREITSFPRFNRSVRWLTFAPDGKTLAAVYGHGVFLWNVTTGLEKQKLDHLEVVDAVAFSQDGKHLATVCYGGGFGVWDVESGRRLCDFRAPRSADEDPPMFGSLAFLPDGKTLAAVMLGDSCVQLWDSATGQLRRKLESHAADVESIAVSPDGKLLASSSDDGTTLVWDAARIGTD
jgi:WD40 repeat protein